MTAMPPPSYARPTASSTSRASPKTSKFANPESPQRTPKKLKRPSTLTDHNREILSNQANLHHIKPQDPSKPCPLATIPSEIRNTIYAYLLGPEPETKLRSYRGAYQALPRLDAYKYRMPSLLKVCRPIRIEAAYTYYTTMPFTWDICNVDFRDLMTWVESLPPEHRALLSRNRNLQIQVQCDVSKNSNWSQDILDGDTDAHWEECGHFGNIYAVQGRSHQKHFVVFCRLAHWWLWCSKPINRDIVWSYDYTYHPTRNCFLQLSEANRLLNFLVTDVSVVMKPWVQKAWMRNRCEKRMKPEALKMLDGFQECFNKTSGTTRKTTQNWTKSMSILKGFVEKW